MVHYNPKQLNEEKFEQVYLLYFNELYRFAYHYIMSDDAQDIVQETFVKIFNNQSLLIEASNIRAYLYRMVKNSCVDYLKHINVQNKHQDGLVDMILDNMNYEDSTEAEVSEKIKVCMSSLPEKQRMIISLRLEGKSYGEISKMLNISEGTVNTHIGRAYKFIKNNYVVIYLILSQLDNK